MNCNCTNFLIFGGLAYLLYSNNLITLSQLFLILALITSFYGLNGNINNNLLINNQSNLNNANGVV